MAAIAHLSFFAGFWLVAPIVIYVMKRKESRFIGFHALQAILVQILSGVLTVAGLVLMIVGGVVAGALRNEAAAVVVMVLSVLLLALPGLGALAAHGVLAYGAWQGKSWEVPLIGRIAKGILGSDEEAAKA
jgi:uncharacterized membrane protein